MPGVVGARRASDARNLIRHSVKEAEILNFVRSSLGSVWALEMLLLAGGRPERIWQIDELVRELRSSPAAVTGAAVLLERAGLITRDSGGWRYQPRSPALDHMGEMVRKVYAVKPATVIGAIFESSNDKLRSFTEAFRFKE